MDRRIEGSFSGKGPHVQFIDYGSSQGLGLPVLVGPSELRVIDVP
jgi:hypothetical protein